MSGYLLFFFAALTLSSVVVAEVARFGNCASNKDKCTVHEVRINPCKEASTNKPCKVRRGRPGSLEIDYTPHFDSQNLTANGVCMGQLFPNMETDACLTTTCPVTAGNRQTYTFNIFVDRKFPSGIFDVDWSLIGATEEDQCCISVKIFLK
ncbi:hypothetical protein PPYR_07075 [Photinus pyralis]|uniref:MD-2-related lipid-recognition domain-containing protein n=1 Tax=Photinus pyralis TaxID=7054 RepID=A0A1Y1KP13_PHOPY|nr:MD-2-related lipid-recognition protein-like [Photinus pyralis]KAB0799195.1 hypothetical protein PPYR_07075 [Photinus pyralis]